MIKVLKANIFLIIISVVILFLFDKFIYAKSSTANFKGISTNNLTYKSDYEESKIIKSSKYKYGNMGMWVANYECLVHETDDSNTLYVIYFIESSIDSSGKLNNKYFRNKELKINVFFQSNKNVKLISDTDSTTNSQTSFSYSIGANLNLSIGNNSSVKGSASFSMDNTQTYNTITLTKHTNETSNKYKKLNNDYIFNFNNYKNGKMVSPNIGEVKERLFIIYAIDNYDSSSYYKTNIKTTASIFKDAVWPKSNATLSGDISFDFYNGYVG